MARSVLHLVATAALVAAVAGPAAAQPKPPTKAPPTKPALAPPDPPPSSSDERIKTSEQVKRGSVEGAATTPLRDLNLMRVDIPEILLKALDDPYERPPRGAKCSTLIALVRPLNDALGPDIDTIPGDDERWTGKSKSAALGVAGDLAGGAIPFRGVVRKLSGAESHDKLVLAAIIAGHTRRAYLKGLGETKGCGPPATPTHERTGFMQAVAAQQEAEKGRFTPKYPTKAPPAGTQTSAGTPPAAPPKPRS